ncbi:MAG: lamin tail domain-containing protein [Candidatus Poribacteria bacterium]|nr:lamin tail domain-containing protein [Candidatus Poribacteria bacterium]
MTYMLAFSLQSIANALIPEVVVPQELKLRTSRTVREVDTVPVAAKDDIAISEIMYATDASATPQWIELHNRSPRKVSLEGWEVKIENHSEDRSVLATKLTFTLGAKILDAGQVLLLVTEQGDNSGVGKAKGDLRVDSIVILKNLIGGTPGYRLLSHTAFKITLMAPTTAKTAHKMPSDIAGNLGTIPEWELPLVEGERSSIVREYKGNDTSDGARVNGWELAAEESTQYIRGITYYGHLSDHGTPGYRETDPLPVELSHFRPARRGKSTEFRLARELVREKPTGVITITWTTQSEINNAGFFIRRSKRRSGKFFNVINAAMVLGAGTINEEQSYTYTDTTAEPNVVYYYQLECVSVDGTRRILTRFTRLKGRVGNYSLFEEAPFWWKDFKR